MKVLSLTQPTLNHGTDQRLATGRRRPGRPRTRTHTYTRHGTLTLLAALDVHTGKVRYACRRRNRHQEFLAFLRQLARRFPTQTVHLILDNYATHSHEKVRTWLQAHPRFRFHFIPTYSSWLNVIEHWFSAFQRHVLAQGSFAGLEALQAALGRYVRDRNRSARPPRWQATAESILGQLAQIEMTCGTVH